MLDSLLDLHFKLKNSAEKEFDKLSLQDNEIFRSTRIPELDQA